MVKGATFRIFQEKEDVVCSEVKIPMLSEGVMMVGEETGAGN
jgi:two-component system LytT family sensor kinase